GGRFSGVALRVSNAMGRAGSAAMRFSTQTTRLGGSLTRLGARLRQASTTTNLFTRSMTRMRSMAGLAGTALISGVLALQDWSATAEKARSETEALNDEIFQNHDMSTLEGM